MHANERHSTLVASIAEMAHCWLDIAALEVYLGNLVLQGSDSCDQEHSLLVWRGGITAQPTTPTTHAWTWDQGHCACSGLRSFANVMPVSALVMSLQGFAIMMVSRHVLKYPL